MSQPANSSAEVHAFPRRHGFNAFEQAKQELAAFKFSLFETVAADPLLRAGQCLNLIIVYASLVTIDKKTLQATPAYASNGRVFVRAGVRSHHTAVKARRLLEQHGYLIPVSRRNGITVYRIENPHHERVQMQIQELEECQREIKNEKNVRNKPQNFPRLRAPNHGALRLNIVRISSDDMVQICTISPPPAVGTSAHSLRRAQVWRLASMA